MLFLALVIFILWILLNNHVNKQMYLFITTLVVTMFFFDSKDPIVGIPLYFYIMLISIAYTFFTKGISKKSSSIIFLFSTIFVLILQMINLLFGINVMKTLLINESNTDVIDITSQLKMPSLNFTVIKHFIFMVLYMFFALLNINLLRQKKTYLFIYKNFIFFFKILFVGIIFESIMTNVIGINIRSIMKILFDTDLNMTSNWETSISLKAVSFWMPEPSSIGIVFIYYFMLLASKEYSLKNLGWILLSFIAVLLTGSTTGLMMAILCGTVLLICMLFSSRTIRNVKILIVFFGVICVIYVISKSSFLFAKLNDFINNTSTYGSAYFRKQSIEYGIEVFKFSPLIGLGIGTNYCHSGLVQILSNIGILGTLFYLYFHISLLPKYKFNLETFFKICVILIYLYASSMIQVLTSPYFLILNFVVSPFFYTPPKLKGVRVINEYLLCCN